MTVVIVKPGYAPYEAEINGLDEMQEVVGGMIQAIYPFEDTRTRSVSKGRSGSSSVNYQQTGRELMTPDEVRALDNDHCILFIRGELPVMDRKYDILKHPDLKLTEDGGAAPYIHCPGLTYALEDFPLPVDSWESIEIIE